MNYTWGEIQILSIQKMFLNNVPLTVSDLTEMREDKKYKLYLNSMPSVANEGLLRLMSVGKPLIKKYTLNHNIPAELLNYQSHETYNVITEDLIVYGSSSQAYYFEIDNQASIEIQLLGDEWTTVKTINHLPEVAGAYTVYKGLIPNTENKPARIVFNGEGFIYNVRYIALYNVKFRNEDEVFNNTLKQKYNLKELIDDFFEIVSVEYEENNKKGQYNSDFILEGDNTLVIDSTLKGNFIITYKAYPDKITSTTSDTYRFNMAGEMIALLPLYIASELYKDDDISLATIYRNQFETGLSQITKIEQPMEFANNSGWL
jgi:hypothetical protein